MVTGPERGGISKESRHGIIAGAAPRVTAEQTADGEIQSLEQPPFAESLQGIFGACRREPASRRLVRRDAHLIESDERDKREYRDFLHDTHDLVPLSVPVNH